MKRFVILVTLAAAAAFFMVPTALAAAPGAIFTCQATGQVDFIDPVVAPGVYPTGHEHTFFGAQDVTPTSSSDSLRASGTSCVTQGNHSAYWMPQPYQNGLRLLPTTTKHFLAYYRCRHSSSVCASLQWFPDNTGAVEGNPNATSPSENPAFRNGLGGWRCGTGGGTFYPTPPACGTGDVLVASNTFGNCLFSDGSISDAINSNCSDHGGRPIPRIQQYFRWKPRYSTSSVPVTLGAIEMPPYTLHSDFLTGWNAATAQDFLDKCIHLNKDCGTNPVLAG